jgi:hypothetical protein
MLAGLPSTEILAVAGARVRFGSHRTTRPRSQAMRQLSCLPFLFVLLPVACGGGGGGGGGGSASFNAATYLGVWSGTWNNTTFGSSGAVSVTVTQTGDTYALQFDMDGNVFGGSNPALESFSASVSAVNASLVSLSSSVYGTLTGTLAANGTLTGSGSAIPGPVDTFTLTGTWNATTITANVTITFDAGGAGANATATLTKQ